MTESSDKIVDIDEEGETITITGFTLEDPDVAEYFRSQDPQQRKERLKAVIQTGVLALKSTDITTRVDYVKKEFERLRRDIDSYFASEGKLPAIMEKYMGDEGKINEILEQYVGENGDMRGAISEMVLDWTKNLKESMDPDNEDGLLFDFKRDIIARIEEIKKNIAHDEGVESMKDKLTKKGIEFEDYPKRINLIGEI